MHNRVFIPRRKPRLMQNGYLLAASDVGFTLEVRIPLKLVSFSNKKNHYMSVHAEAKRQKALVEACLVGNYQRLASQADEVHFERVFVNRAHAMDSDDNLRHAFKYVKDSVAEYIGVVDDDSCKVRWLYGQRVSNQIGIVISFRGGSHAGRG